ncbi:DUF3786 domain-containing protein [Acetonema longum]|uniref:DUF3786 domain-containing protein n=1 Tax=Acetonema longum DSM 6540 TaxID=1009370 RepID=F7NHV2_9FIRM|nr:DUF3786 domain-containing protein [Acetonema longum]EGO64477.1 hypothetical protein ALO_08248 [Acetonema longum DSM 6540]
METNYRIAYDKGWQDVKKKLPEEIVSRRSVSYCSSKNQFTVPFFNSEYILDCRNETITGKTAGQIPDITASIIILNYLSFSDISPTPDKKWVSLKEIPKGGALFYPAFRKNTIEVLLKTFGKQPKELLTCAAALGGQSASLGSASVVFHAFPEIPLCIVMWEGDEEVRANATVLYDPSIADILHVESIIGLGMYLAAKLNQLASR